ncbi:Retrovirus-related Pol polyprotein from type-2 retrotransposable element R2DM [Araneus ventricosus]|uniref:Retrovirus-related Pol polyprotein from type-2 retrotransposable element R2DM n=1 Tax=Araneus ventricosus TaxID=182803 RepID=A0A4Y2SPQ5_ARAVE|nr:Retrovirus-related Pol polyprotein from type-2 retrotransposable element R2DM [Araneus ventricosus]
MYYPKLLTYEGIELKSTGQVHTRMRWKLLEAIDRAGLREAGQVPAASSWILVGTPLMTGRNYISSAQLRLNTLYSRSRAARGRSTNHQCYRGCPQPETLNHMLQVCYSTHTPRVTRHKIVVYLQRGAEERGFTVNKEPQFETSVGLLKHNLVLYRPDSTTVLDV